MSVESDILAHAPPRHVAVIMDGNGRWANTRGKPRFSGHRAGVKSARRIVEGCARAGVEVLTLFAFREWSQLSELLAARGSDPELREWFAYRDALVEKVEELVLLPGRLNPLGIRD